MPLYEFECLVGHHTEELVSSDVQCIPCPKCYQPPPGSGLANEAIRVVSAPPTTFKFADRKLKP